MRSLILTSLALASFSVFATDKHPAPPPKPTYFLQGQNQELYNNPVNTLKNTNTLSSDSSAISSPVQSYNAEGSNTYFFPAPVTAAPLPPGLCPQGDSESISFLWNFFSYSKSSTRTEMECLDKVLAAIKPEVKVVEKIVQVPVEKTVYVEQKCPTPTPAAKKTVVKKAAPVCKK